MWQRFKLFWINDAITGIGIVIALALLSLSAWFYLERTIFCDIAYHTFTLIRTKQLLMGHFRFGSAITQLPILLLCKWNAPLQLVLIAYSLIYPIYYVTVFAIIRWGFKNKLLAIIQLGFYVWFASDTFYWMQSELQQGISALLLFVAAITYYQQQQKKTLACLLSLIGIPFLFTFHPLMVFAITYIILYWFFFEKQMSLIQLAFYFAALLLTWLLKQKYLSNSYDDSHQLGISNIIHYFPNYYKLQSFKSFIHYLVADYKLWVLFCSALLSYLATQGNKKLVAFVVVYCLAYTILIVAVFEGGGEKFYFDNMYSLLGLFLAIPVFMAAQRQWQRFTKWTFVLIVITVVRIGQVYQTHQAYTDRIKWHQEVIADARQNHLTKISIPPNAKLEHQLKMTWAMAYESALLSSLNYQTTVSYYMAYAPMTTDSILHFNAAAPNKAGQLFIAQFEQLPQTQLPSSYYQFSNAAYVVDSTLALKALSEVSAAKH